MVEEKLAPKFSIPDIFMFFLTVIKNIVLGRNYQSEVEILSGVDEGVLVVDEGRSTVLEGQEVEVISSK